MSYEGYNEALVSQKQKEDELKTIKDQQAVMNDMLTKLVASLSNTTNQQELNTIAKSLANSGILRPSSNNNG